MISQNSNLWLFQMSSLIQCLSYLACKVFCCKRFLNEAHAFIEDAMIGNDASGMAAHKKTLELGIARQ